MLKIFSFDVESIGLHGEAFAVGWVLLDANGIVLDSARMAIDPSTVKGAAVDRAWVAANIPPIPVTHINGIAMRRDFWTCMQSAKILGAIILGDCVWPVETNFLSACVADDPLTRGWSGPYPLIDVASVIAATGGDPCAVTERLADELPVHDPVADALHSARQYLKLL